MGDSVPLVALDRQPRADGLAVIEVIRPAARRCDEFGGRPVVPDRLADE